MRWGNTPSPQCKKGVGLALARPFTPATDDVRVFVWMFYYFSTVYDCLSSLSATAVADASEQRDYVVGLVSDSLTADQTTPGTLSSLFSVAATKNTPLFIPAPKVSMQA